MRNWRDVFPYRSNGVIERGLPLEEYVVSSCEVDGAEGEN